MICLIDSGWRTKSEAGVYDFCLNKSAGRFIPVKGATRAQGLKRTVEESDQDFKGRNIKLVRFDEPVLKYDLYFNKIKQRDSKWWLPVNTGPDYEAQLTDEFLRKEKGQDVWDTKEGNNHLADCEKMQLILPALIESLQGKGALQKLADLLKAKIS
jgi:hypothetical protein